jgi:hypothetical protein
MPETSSFFSDAIDEMDPSQEVEETYWSINDPKFCWRALRLLGRERLHYFSDFGGQQTKTVTDYLKGAIKRLVRERPAIDEAFLMASGDAHAKRQGDAVGLKHLFLHSNSSSGKGARHNH